MQRPAPGKATLVVFLGALSSGACGIVQGFQDASNAVFPPEETYLDAPGFRLVKGGRRSLEFAAGTDLFLLARSAEPDDHALYAMLYADPKPCTIPNVGAHWTSDGSLKGPAMIAYFADDDQGTLHFADATCRTYDLTVTKSWLPFLQKSDGFVVLSGTDIVLADPAAGTQRTLITSVENIYGNGLPGYVFVQAAGRFYAFGPEWKDAGVFGDGVSNAGGVGNSFFFEDGAGIHRVTVGGGDPPLVDSIITPYGCSLGFTQSLGASESWIAYLSPCAAPRLWLYGEASEQTSQLDFLADPRYLALLPAWPNLEGDPAVDPFYFFYLEKPDDTTGRGALIMRGPDRRPVALGKNSALERTTVIAGETETYGYAMVDVDEDGVGRYLRWNADGSVEEIAKKVLRWSGDLIVDYDGRTGDFALPAPGGVAVVARRAAPGRFKFRDGKGRWTAVLHDFDGANGSLSITPSSLDFREAARALAAPPALTTIATGVRADWRAAFISSVPGIAYLTSYDTERNAGRLDYRNLELLFTATVSEGVSDYVSTSDGLIYSVPFGDRAGIWLVRAR